MDSLETARALLEQRGVKFTEAVKPAGGGGRVLFFRDAEDNLLHLVERSAESPLAGRPGSTARRRRTRALWRAHPGAARMASRRDRVPLAVKDTLEQLTGTTNWSSRRFALDQPRFKKPLHGI